MKDTHESSYNWKIRIEEIQNSTDLAMLKKQFEEDISDLSPYEIPIILNAFDRKKLELKK